MMSAFLPNRLTQKNFVVTVERIIPGGNGIGFINRKAVFIPLAVPGDKLQVRRVVDKGSYMEAIQSDLLEASTQRYSPLCSYFGRCGGCDFQQIKYEKQLLSKRDILWDAMIHVNKIDFPKEQIELIPSPPSLYRNRIKLKVLWERKKISWGFYFPSSHRLCSINHCWIAKNSLWNVLPLLKKNLEDLPFEFRNLIEVEIFQGDKRDILVDLRVKPKTRNLNSLRRALLNQSLGWNHQKISIILSRSQKQKLSVLGPGFVTKVVRGWKFKVSSGSFFQINDYMLNTLAENVVNGTKGKQAIDLFCGVGFFSIPLAEMFSEVLAVDNNPSAIEDFKSNIKQNNINNCRLFKMEVDGFLSLNSLKPKDIDLILLDPPRSGLEQSTVQKICKLNVPRIIYVSCDPSTLARDLAGLLQGGYCISKLKILDLFPQSHHLETVVKLNRI